MVCFKTAKIAKQVCSLGHTKLLKASIITCHCREQNNAVILAEVRTPMAQFNFPES